MNTPKQYIRPGSRHNTRAAKLTLEQVHCIRSLRLAGFSIASIGSALGINVSTVQNITSNHRWYHVPFVPSLPPLLPPACTGQLRIHRPNTLTREQKQALKEYRQRLEQYHDATAAMEGHAVDRLRWWTEKVARACDDATTDRDKMPSDGGYAT